MPFPRRGSTCKPRASAAPVGVSEPWVRQKKEFRPGGAICEVSSVIDHIMRPHMSPLRGEILVLPNPGFAYPYRGYARPGLTRAPPPEKRHKNGPLRLGELQKNRMISMKKTACFFIKSHTLAQGERLASPGSGNKKIESRRGDM